MASNCPALLPVTASRPLLASIPTRSTPMKKPVISSDLAKLIGRRLIPGLLAAIIVWCGWLRWSVDDAAQGSVGGEIPGQPADESSKGGFAAPALGNRSVLPAPIQAGSNGRAPTAVGTGGAAVAEAEIFEAESVSGSQNARGTLAGELSEALRRIEAVEPDLAVRAGRNGTRYFAQNPAQELCAFFQADRLRVESGRGEPSSDWHLELGFQGIALTAEATGNRIEYRHADGTVEWFDNRVEGIEHGYVLSRRPEAEPAGEVTLRVPVSGVRASLSPTGRVDFLDAAGRTVAGYDKLKVWDAGGRELPAAMRVGEGGAEILLAYQDDGAVYPVTVDPLIINLEATLGSSSETRDGFGQTLAMDGNLLVVGCPQADTLNGADSGLLYVFQRDASNGEWSTVTGLKRPFGGQPLTNYWLGAAVAVRGDLIVGGSPRADLYDSQDELDEEDCGEAVVFRKVDGFWVFETILTASDADGSEIPNEFFGRGGDAFGGTVAVEGDVIAIGAPREDPNNDHADGDGHGAVYLFVETGGGWDESAKFYYSGAGPGNGMSGAYFGSALSISGDTVAVGAEHATLTSEVVNFQAGSNGAVDVLVRSGPAQWTLQQTFVQPGGPKVLHQFGFSVCVEGDTMVVGSPGQGGYDNGAFSSERAWVYTRSDGVWTVQALLAPQGAHSSGMFGWAVAVQGDVAVIGAPFERYRNGTSWEEGTSDGAAYVFSRIGTTWAQSGRIEPDAAILSDNSELGFAVAAGDGVVAVGAPDETPAMVLAYAVEGSAFRVRDANLAGVPGQGIEGATVRVVVGEQVFSISSTDAAGVFTVDEGQVNLEDLHDVWISKNGVERIYQAVRLSDPAQRSFVLPVLLRTRVAEELVKLETTAPLVTAYETAGARDLLAEWNTLTPLPTTTHQERDRALSRLLLATQGMATVFTDTHLVSMDAAKLTVGTFVSLTAYRKIISDATAKAARKAELAKLVQGTSIERVANVALELLLKASARAVGDVQRTITRILQSILPAWAVQLFDQAVTVVTKGAFAFLGENNNNGTNDWETNLKRNNTAAMKTSLQTLVEFLAAEVGGRILSSAYVLETRPSLNLAAARTRNRDFEGTFPEAANATAAVWIESQEKTAVTLDFSKTVGTITRDLGTIADITAVCAKAPGGQALATVSTALRAFNNALLIDATFRDYSLLLENAFDRGPQVAELPFRPSAGGGGGGPTAAPPPGAPPEDPPQGSPPEGFDPSAYITLLNSIRGRIETPDAAGLLDDAELLGAAGDTMLAAMDLLMEQLASSAQAAVPRREYLDRELISAADLAGQLQLDQMRLYPALAEKLLPGIASPAPSDAEILGLIDQMVARLGNIQLMFAGMIAWTSDLTSGPDPVVLSHGLPEAQQVLGAEAGVATLHAVVANAGGSDAEGVTVTLEVAAPADGGPAAITPLSPLTVSVGSLAAGASATLSWQVRLTDTSPLADGVAASYLLRIESAGSPPEQVFGMVEVKPSGGAFADWIAAQPGVAAADGYLGDPDTDGTPNALERFFGTPPGSPSGDGWLGPVLGDGGSPRFVHRRASSPGADAQVDYEWSLNLLDWHPAGTEGDGLTVNLKPRVVAVEGDGSLRVEVTPEVPAGTGMPGKLFVRIGVSPVAEPTPGPPAPLPEILVQPVGGSFGTGSEVTLEVQVAGTAPVTYLWHRNGQPLYGEVTRVLVLPSLASGNTGAYKVVITGEGGQVVSDEVQVTETGGGGD